MVMAREENEVSTLPRHEKYEQLISTLPSCIGWSSRLNYNFQGFWYPSVLLPGAMAFRDHFNPLPTDILLLSPPKSGTTWLKALAFATVHRKQYNPSDPNHPLLHLHPHDSVPLVDEIFGAGLESKLDTLPQPRVLSVHMAYSLLPESVKRSDCRLIYICREPKDTLVSTWHFSKAVTPDGVEPLTFHEAFEMFCKGICAFGPLWEHMLECWRESFIRPEKVLFLKYEEMMEDPVENLKRLAEFAGCSFSKEEENKRVVEEIVRLCSFEKLKSVEVNQKGDRGIKQINISNSSYFRNGKVGDWKNHLTPEMVTKLDKIIEEKLGPSGLSFGRLEDS